MVGLFVQGNFFYQANPNFFSIIKVGLFLRDTSVSCVTQTKPRVKTSRDNKRRRIRINLFKIILFLKELWKIRNIKFSTARMINGCCKLLSMIVLLYIFYYFWLHLIDLCIRNLNLKKMWNNQSKCLFLTSECWMLNLHRLFFFNVRIWKLC